MKQTFQPIQIKVLKKGEMLRARWSSSSYARKHLSAQQVHRQMLRNGSVLSPNPFYTGRKTQEECYRLLNSET